MFEDEETARLNELSDLIRENDRLRAALDRLAAGLEASKIEAREAPVTKTSKGPTVESRLDALERGYGRILVRLCELEAPKIERTPMAKERLAGVEGVQT